MFKNRDTENEAVRLMMFPLSLTGEAKTWLDELNEGTIKTWDELRTAFIRNCHGHNLSKGNTIKFFHHGLNEITQEILNAAVVVFSFIKLQIKFISFSKIKSYSSSPGLKTKKPDHLLKTVAFADEGKSNSESKKIMARMDAMTVKIDAQYKEFQSYAKQPTPDLDDDDIPICDVIDEILEEYFDALLEEGSKILHSIEGTILEEEIFFEFDKFIAITADEYYDSEFDTEEPPFKKITINTDYKIKASLKEPPIDLELKPLPDNLEYVFLGEPSFLPVIISSKLSAQNKSKLLYVLKKHKEAFAWKTTYILEKHLLLMAIDSKYIMKKKIIMTKGKQSLPSFSKNKLKKQESR
nr:reverse transcriptase domain-containing protein [Tanacetum cinerariifolium]